MRTLRLLASLPAVFFFIFINPGEAAEGEESPKASAPKVSSGPQLLSYLAKPETTVQQGVEASAMFVKNLLNSVIKDKEALGEVEKAIKLTVDQFSDRTETLGRMSDIAKRLEEENLGRGERETLVEQLKELAEYFKARNQEMLAEGLGAIGISKAEAQEIVSKKGLLSQVASLLEDAALTPFQKHF